MGVYKTDGAAPAGRIDVARVDATTEAEIERQMLEDDLAALADAVDYARQRRPSQR